MKKRTRIPWSETPEGKEHEEFARRAKLGRPPTNESLCFVCQERAPGYLIKREAEEFKVCKECMELVRAQNEQDNRIRQALARGHGGALFTMTLGANLLPR